MAILTRHSNHIKRLAGDGRTTPVTDQTLLHGSSLTSTYEPEQGRQHQMNMMDHVHFIGGIQALLVSLPLRVFQA